MKATSLGPTLVLSLALVSALTGCSGATTTESAARTGALLGALDDGWAGAATGAILGGAFGAAVDNAENKKDREARKQREQPLAHRVVGDTGSISTHGLDRAPAPKNPRHDPGNRASTLKQLLQTPQ